MTEDNERRSVDLPGGAELARQTNGEIWLHFEGDGKRGMIRLDAHGEIVNAAVRAWAAKLLDEKEEPADKFDLLGKVEARLLRAAEAHVTNHGDCAECAAYINGSASSPSSESEKGESVNTCTCTPCPECSGTGTVWFDCQGRYLGRSRADDLDELEVCMECDGSGVTDVCGSCQDEEEESRAIDGDL